MPHREDAPPSDADILEAMKHARGPCGLYDDRFEGLPLELKAVAEAARSVSHLVVCMYFHLHFLLHGDLEDAKVLEELEPDRELGEWQPDRKTVLVSMAGLLWSTDELMLRLEPVARLIACRAGPEARTASFWGGEQTSDQILEPSVCAVILRWGQIVGTHVVVTATGRPEAFVGGPAAVLSDLVRYYQDKSCLEDLEDMIYRAAAWMRDRDVQGLIAEECGLAARVLMDRESAPPRPDGAGLPGAPKATRTAERRKPGRKPPSREQIEADRRLADAWATGHHRTHKDLAREMGMKVWEVTQALERVRKRR